MICAYCGNNRKGTKEHIISKGILDLFPECFMTYDYERNEVYPSDPIIKDVCADCNNNKISYIDSYAKEMVKKYFTVNYQKDDNLIFEYNYTLIQKMCLKYAFNDLRSRKKDTNFFDLDIKRFILNKELNKPLSNVTILAGLSINTSPIPDCMLGNNKLRWCCNPLFLSNSIIENIDYYSGKYILRKDNKPQRFEKYALSFLIRLNSLQLLMICWDKNISEEQLFQNNIILEIQYPYTKLTPNGKTSLSRCTSELTYAIEQLIDVSWGQSIFDDISYMRGTFSDNAQLFLSEIEKHWKAEEQSLAKLHPRK